MLENDDHAVGLLESELGWTFGHSAGGEYFVEADRLYNDSTWTYRFPSDSHEVIRMDRQHYVLLRSLPGLYRGPDAGLVYRHTRWQKPFLKSNASESTLCLYITNVLFPTSLSSAATLHPASKPLPTTLSTLILIHEVHVTFVSAWKGFKPEDLMPVMTQITVLVREAFLYRGVRLELFESMAEVLSSAGFSPEDTNTYYHYRQGCNNKPDSPEYALPFHLALRLTPSSESGREDAENFIAYAFACRLVLLESGVNEEGFDRLWRQMSREVRGQSSGVGGPLGGQGVLSAWGC
ncbi:hypothetical protein IAR50_003561 [Cryptococcus sp. DSM 104548]